MSRAPRRALLGVLSVSAVLVPAVGIAYLGAVSYEADRGLVADKVEEQLVAAQVVARELEAQLGGILGHVDSEFAKNGVGSRTVSELLTVHPNIEFPFVIDAAEQLVYPSPNRLGAAIYSGVSRRGVPREPCLSARCLQAAKAAANRLRQLELARELELGECSAQGTCIQSVRQAAEARRIYRRLSRFDATAPEALMGLYRLDRAAGDSASAIAKVRAIGERFGEYGFGEGLSYGAVAAFARAELAEDSREFLLLAERIIAGQYGGSHAALAAMLERCRARVQSKELGDVLQARLRELDKTLEDLRRESAFAAAIAPERAEIVRTASQQAKGRPAFAGSHRTLVFKRKEDGSIVGFLLGHDALAAMAKDAALRSGHVAVVHRLGRMPDRSRARVLATAAFGAILGHMSLSLVSDLRLPDPLDEIVRTRSRRHLAVVGGLFALLIVGVVATIRGAARERELARLKSDFVSTVSHELKTPLTSVRMFAEMLQQGVARGNREQEARYHEIIVKEAERLSLLIANLLDYSQIERGSLKYKREPVLVSELAHESARTFGRLREGGGHNVIVAVDDSAELSHVVVDRDVVVQSLLNLLANAAKYGGGDNPIELRVANRDSNVVISVRDQGPGIPSSEQSRVFREFYRSPSAYKSGVEGTGLGLALVKRHVEAQGGQIELESALGMGATFRMLFPSVSELEEAV